jgi:protocatechuate 3,4-dioxygenase beta subunit
VDIWLANAQGIYSGVGSQGDELGAGTKSVRFLRGTQLTDASGRVTFKAIYPGWYPARTIHIHEKIWLNGREVLTTQTYFTDKQNAAVMATAPYNKRGPQRVTNSNDMVLTRGGTNLLAALMKLVGPQASFTFIVPR